MTPTISTLAIAALALGAVAPPANDPGPSILLLLPGDHVARTAAALSQSFHPLGNLLLYGAGRRAAPPGSLAIPVPVQGDAYEVIVVEPGEGRLIPLGREEGQAR